MPPIIQAKPSINSAPVPAKETNGHDSSPLEVFHCHGLIVPEPRPGTTNAAVECPWCGKEKFFVNVKTAQWDCLVGDTKVLTKSGHVDIRSLNGKTVELLTPSGWQWCPVKSGGVQKTFTVTMVRDRREKKVTCTLNHRWILRDGTEVTTADLLPGHRLAYVVAPKVDDTCPEGIKHGIMYGDGNNSHVCLYGDKVSLLPYLTQGKVSPIGDGDIRVNGQNKAYKDLPSLEASDEYLHGFIKGYFATDGTSVSCTRIDSANRQSLEFVRNAATRLGFVVSQVTGYWRKGFPGYEGMMYYLAFHRSTLTPDFFIREEQKASFLAKGNYGGSKRLSWRVTSVDLAEDAEVFCAIVAGDQSFALDDNLLTGNCKVCGESGNGYGFLRSLWKHSMEATTEADYRALATSRNLLDWQTPKAWGCCKSILTGLWLVPGHGLDGKLNQLYRWTPIAKPDKPGAHALFATTGHAQTLFGTPLRDAKKPGTYVCEGPWDGMALWEVLRKAKRGDNGALLQTGNESGSLYADANVIATPGANLSEAWLPALAGEWAALLYDSDHPHEANGKLVEGAGIAGMRRAAQRIAVGESRPKELHYLEWGVDGFDPNRPSGTDVRDVLGSNGAGTFAKRIENLGPLLAKVVPVPADWYAGAKPKAKGKNVPGKNQVEVAALKCESWTTLVAQWKRAMQWGEGLDRALSVMLASLTSTNSIGDQLWVMLTSPPSTGKSTLCEALSANLRHVVAKSTMRGFHSGYQTDEDGSEDHSLLAKLHGKTLITKDGDTLLQSPNLGQILSEARDVYDRVSRTSYRNKSSRDYVGVSMTWILCGTSALRSLDTSELGERFIKCTIMDGIDAETEKDIIRKILYRQRDNKGVSLEDSTALSDPDTAKAVQLTSGYIDYLGQWGNILLQKINDTDEQLEKILDLARFVAFLRARPSKRQMETVERELAARLSSQLHRLATCLAVVLQRPTLDAEVMRRVVRCAMDTARGRTLDIVKVLARHGTDGVNLKALAMMTNQSEGSERTFLQMLRKLKAVELYEAKVAGIAQRKAAWRLTEDFAKLYASVASLSPECV